MPLDENEQVTGGSGVEPSTLKIGTYQFTLVDIQKREMKRGQAFTDPAKGQTADDLVTKLELHFKEDKSGDILTKLVGFSTVEKSGLYKDVLPALNGGSPGIPPGSPVSGKLLNSLIGRKCLASVVLNARDYAKIGNLIPLPGAESVPLVEGPSGFKGKPTPAGTSKSDVNAQLAAAEAAGDELEEVNF